MNHWGPKIKQEAGVKSEDGDGGRVNLSSIPMASAATKSEDNKLDTKPNFFGGAPALEAAASHHAAELPSSSSKKRKKYWQHFARRIVVKRGADRVSAHYDKQKKVLQVEITSSDSPVSWEPSHAEQELFAKLRQANFNLAPANGWGFLKRVMKNAADAIETGGRREFKWRVDVAVRGDSSKPKKRSNSAMASSSPSPGLAGFSKSMDQWAAKNGIRIADPSPAFDNLANKTEEMFNLARQESLKPPGITGSEKLASATREVFNLMDEAFQGEGTEDPEGTVVILGLGAGGNKDKLP